MSFLHYCSHCKQYTLETTCSQCHQQTKRQQPPRYSPQDRLGKYRRTLKKLS